MVWEETKKNRARTGFSGFSKNSVLESSRSTGALAHGYDDSSRTKEPQGPHQQVGKTPKRRTQEIGDSNTECSKRQEIEFNSKAQRAQGGKGLLSQSISVQESQKSINKVLVLEKKEKNRKKGGRGRPGEESGGVWLLGSRGR